MHRFLLKEAVDTRLDRRRLRYRGLFSLFFLSRMAVIGVCLLSGFFIAPSAFARLVSYPGGTTLMQNNNGMSSSLLVHHSFSAKDAIGYRAEWFRHSDQHFHGLQWNRLAKRWNQPESQANWYLRSSLGVNHTHTGNTLAAGLIGMTADWESRRWFTAYSNRYVVDEASSFFTQQARIGMAPYLGDYGDWHSWIMLQFDHRPTHNITKTAVAQTETTLLLRVFKGAYLAEVGFSDHSNVLFNMIARF